MKKTNIKTNDYYISYRQKCSGDDYRQSLIDQFNYTDQGLENHIKLIEKSEKQALAYYLAMPNKDIKTICHIIRCYLHGYGTEKNLAEVYHWLKKTKPKDPKMQLMIAVAYEYGLSMPIDMNKAFKWYRKSARQGNSEAIDRMDRPFR